MAKIYANLINAGLKNINDIPIFLKEQVLSLLNNGGVL